MAIDEAEPNSIDAVHPCAAGFGTGAGHARPMEWRPLPAASGSAMSEWTIRN